MGPCALGPHALKKEKSSCKMTASGGDRTKVDARLRDGVHTALQQRGPKPLWRH
jgi:hypothetical protein